MVIHRRADGDTSGYKVLMLAWRYRLSSAYVAACTALLILVSMPK